MCLVIEPVSRVEPVPPPTAVTRRYVPELDGLRGIAVLLVMLFHADRDGPFQGGFIGVDVFFVLSAFLITSILVEEQERTGTMRLGRFYWRRALRLMPALLLFLAAYLAVAPFVFPGYPHLRDALIAGLYVSNFAFVAAQIPPFISHTWSLAAEEQFYLLWPLTLLFLLRFSRPVWILASVWAGLTLLRLGTENWIAYYYGLATHGTGLIMGAILYFLVRDGALSPRPVHALIAAAIIALLATTAQMHVSAIVITVAEFAAAILIGTAVTNPASLRILTAPALVNLGKLSYGLYLWHFPISYALREVGGFWETFAITFALSLGLALLSYVTVEAWARKLKDAPGAASRLTASIPDIASPEKS